jgi:hypothetical protein
MPSYEVGASRRVFPEGAYYFKCNDAYLETSSKGNPMIVLDLIVSGRNGEEAIEVTDYLVFSKDSVWKIDDFRLATGETDLKSGETVNFEAEDCFDRQGYCSLITDTYQGRQSNKVGGYIIDRDTIAPQIRAISGEPGFSPKSAPTQTVSAQSGSGSSLDDDLNF